MGSINPLQSLSLMQEVLQLTYPMDRRKAYTEYSESFLRQFPLETDSIGDDGRRYDFDTGPEDNTVASGRLSSTFTYPRPETQNTVDSFVIKPAHINSLQTPLTVLFADLEFANEPMIAHDIGFNKTEKAYRDMAAKRDILMWSDRRAKIGGVQAAIQNDTEDETNDFHTFDLYLDESTIPAAFTKGRLLHICVDATPVATLRNYHTPIEVIENIQVSDGAVAGAQYKVKCKQSYLAADIVAAGGITDGSEGEAEVETALGLIADGDIVCVWGGATASNVTMPSHGPNYGYWGFRSLYARDDIQTATGACSIAITTYKGTTVTRAAGGNFGWMVPSIVAKSGAQITWADIDTMALNLDLLNPGDPITVLMANPLVLNSLANQAGVDAHRFNGSVDNVTQQIFAMYGVSGAVYRSIVTGKPIVLIHENHLAPDCVVSPVKSAIRRLAPAPASFVPSSGGGLWELRKDTSTGKAMPIYDAVLHESQQLAPTADLRLAGIVSGGKP